MQTQEPKGVYVVKKKILLPSGAVIALAIGATFAPLNMQAFAQGATDVPGTASLGLANFKDLGPAPSSATMNVLVYLKLQNQGNLQQDIKNHVTLTPAQFHAQFSPTSQNYHAVENQLQHAGLTITGLSDNNAALDVTGTVSQIESAFGTTINQYQDTAGNSFLANPSDYHVTGALAAQLVGATGIDQYSEPQPMIQSTATAVTNNETLVPSSTSGANGFFAGNNSADIQHAYNFDPVYQSGLDGSGQTIAIVDAYGSPTIQSDLQTYQQQVEQGAYGASDPLDLQVISPPGLTQVATQNPIKAGDAAGWAGEVSMDVELSHAAAPGAKILFVATPNSGSDLYMGVNQVIDKHLANQMSLSFDSPEAYTPASERTAINQMFEQAAVEGINVFVAAGDWGDYSPSLGYKDVGFPASDPNVVSVGGSSLFVDKNNTYQSEIPWGENFDKIVHPDGTVIPGPIFWFGTGGGVSNDFAKPSWQTGVPGLDSTITTRQVPDVGYNADPLTGFALVQGGQVQAGWGGTSDAAPQWAAIAALANQGHTQKFGTALPFIDPILYANGQAAFHDVLPGTLNVMFTGSVSGNKYYVTMGQDTSLNATAGWDDTTGLGTPDVSKIVSELANAQ